MKKSFLSLGAIVAIVIGVATAIIISNDSATPETKNTQTEVTWCLSPTPEEETCYEPISIKAEATAYDSLEKLAEREDEVTYSGTDYGGEMGYFVESINGKQSDSQAFWKLYRNNKATQKGISSIIPDDGDELTFAYEPVENYEE